jgi:hypothetical protein
VDDRSTISLSRRCTANDGGSVGFDAVGPGSAGRCRERFACAATALVSHVRFAPDPTCADHTVFSLFVAQVGRIADGNKIDTLPRRRISSWVQCRIATRSATSRGTKSTRRVAASVPHALTAFRKP